MVVMRSALYHLASAVVIILMYSCAFCLTAHASSLQLWNDETSVRRSLTQPVGQSVECAGVIVDRIAARNNPPYFVVRDAFKMDANATGDHTDWLADFSAGDYFVGSAAHTTNGLVYTGNDNSRFYVLDANTLAAIVPGGYFDSAIGYGFICSSPAIGYNVDAAHNRWVFITTRAGDGKLYAFKTNR